MTEEDKPIPKNIYGVTKAAAEDLCQLFHRNQGLACVVLRTSRFFPEEDDNQVTRETYADDNARANEFLFRRVDLEDAVSAHMLAGKRAAAIGNSRETDGWPPGGSLDQPKRIRKRTSPLVRLLNSLGA